MVCTRTEGKNNQKQQEDNKATTHCVKVVQFYFNNQGARNKGNKLWDLLASRFNHHKLTIKAYYFLLEINREYFNNGYIVTTLQQSG